MFSVRADRQVIQRVVAGSLREAAKGNVDTEVRSPPGPLRSSRQADGTFLLGKGSLSRPLPALLLLFWLMRRMAASRMTARFLLAPLLAILAGMALERSAPPLRGWIGMALLAGAQDGSCWRAQETPKRKRWFR